MKSSYFFQLIVSIILFSGSIAPVNAGWDDLNTGINDHLTGVSFWGNNGIVSGKKGLYYTTTGGNGAASWTRFNITGNSTDSTIYNNTQFNHCYTFLNATPNTAFVCGNDTVNNKAVIGSLDISSNTFNLIYYGSSGNTLNKINYCTNNSMYYSVGSNGLVVQFSPSSATVISTGLTNNLTSIAFYNSKFWIGASGVRIWGSDINSFSYSTYLEPTEEFNDVVFSSNTLAYGVGNSYYHASALNNISEFDNYDFGPLNARSVYLSGTTVFVGTDHGIFRSEGPGNSTLEYFPTSSQESINHITRDNTTAVFYAAGDNGVVLSSSDFGGDSKPYTWLTADNGDCVNGYIYFNAQEGSSTYCTWYINGVYETSGCNNKNFHFDTAGYYTVELISYNGPYGDTASHSFYITEEPLVNHPVSLLDSVICQQGPITITIDTSELNVKYQLMKFGEANHYGTSAGGTGNAITFTSNTLYEGGAYYIRAQSTLSDCYKNFTDTVWVTVEKTTAKYHVEKVNVTPGELLNIYEATTDADNFSWTFTPSATIGSSTDSIVVNSFNSFGNTQIKLICWSDDGCYDSILGPGPRVYQTPSPTDSCWTNHNLAPDPSWEGYYYRDISKFVPGRDGYYTCGYYHNLPIATQNGDSVMLSGEGGYMAKHAMDGTIRWSVKTIKDGYGDRQVIDAVQEDSEGNLYICGNTDTYFYDNSGDSAAVLYHNDFIAKLDSAGKLIWLLTSQYLDPYNLSIDEEDNLLVSGTLYNGYNTIFKKDGIAVDTAHYQNGNCNHSIVKLAPNGDVVWGMAVDIDNTNGGELTEIDFDQNNNIYLAGIFEHDITFYAPSNAIASNIPGYNNDFGNKTYMAKFDSDGNFIWGNRATVIGPPNAQSSPHDLVTDSIGNCYISGSAYLVDYFNSHYFQFENTDGTTTDAYHGSMFTAKIDSSGVCQWIQGSKHDNMSSYTNIDLYNGEVSVVGTIGFNVDTIRAEFFSENGNNIDFFHTTCDYLVAVYDTMGNVKRVHVSGMNEHISGFNSYKGPGMFRDDYGAYYLGRNFYNTYIDLWNFDDLMSPTGQIDGFITKFSGSCGLTYYPGYNRIDTVFACIGSDYTFPDGSMVSNINSRIVYDSHLINSSGADSVIVTIIDTISQYPRTENYLLCAGTSHTFPDGVSQTITGPTTYISNLPTGSGCDSVITTIIDTYTYINYYDTLSVCSGVDYTFPDGYVMYNVTAQSTHQSILTGSLGCDSIVIRTLIPNSYLANQDTTVCIGASFTFEDGTVVNNLTSDMVHDNIFSDVNGCDSIIRTTVYVLSYASSHTDTICEGDSYTFADGTIMQNLTAPTSYTSVLSSAAMGCDSLVTTDIWIYEVDSTVTQTGNQLYANSFIGVFQWYDCDTWTPIPNATSATFTPTYNGSFAVIVEEDNWCQDTSECFTVTGIGIEENTWNNVNVYPNPTTNEFNIDLGSEHQNVTISIFDITGKLLDRFRYDVFRNGVISKGYSVGIYHIKISTNKGTVTSKIQFIPE